MRLGFNGATTIRAPLLEDVEIAAAAGYDDLEIWAAKLPEVLDRMSPEQLGNRVRQAGLRPWTVNSVEDITFQTDAGADRVRDEVFRLSEMTHRFGARHLIVVPGMLPDGATEQDAVSESISVLSSLRKYAERYDIGLAYEFIGQPGRAVRTLDTAWEVVRRLDHPAFGLVLDVFHFYTGGSPPESISGVDPRKLFVVHINDAEDGDPDTLTDAQRLMPGDGVIPLEVIFRTLWDIGYDGLVSVELFRPEFWEAEPGEVARMAYRKTKPFVRGEP